jgi:hypothetical protein
MENRNVIDKRSVRLEDVLRPDYIPFLGGRPKREAVIGKEDIINVVIELNTSATVDEFLGKI